jgi:rhodanese-related sulfurtransferase
MNKNMSLFIILAFIFVVAIIFWGPYNNINIRQTGESIYSTVTYNYVDVNVSQAYQMINSYPDIILVDLSPFFGIAHIPGAVNYYEGDASLYSAIPYMNKSAVYLVYSHNEISSRKGAQDLINNNFEHVYRIVNGLDDWNASGYPIVYP